MKLALWLFCTAIVGGQMAGLLLAYLNGLWIVDESGRPLMTDFMGYWSAGLSVLRGNPAAAYDWDAIYGLQHEIAPGAFGFAPFPYPPTFLLIATPLSALPYDLAFLLFVGLTLAAYIVVIWLIAKKTTAVALAIAAPATFVAASIGQGGLLWAALIGATLLSLETRPALAGAFLGLLTLKPHLGVLFPIILAVNRKWHVFLYASVTAILLALLAAIIFGYDTYPAALESMSKSANIGLNTGYNLGTEGWMKLHSVYGAARSLGLDNTAAITLQVGVAIATLSAVMWIWRETDSHALRAAAASASTLIFTPHVFLYDYTILAVATAFLYRDRPFNQTEWGVVIASHAMIAILSRYPVPIGFVAPLILIAITLWRVRTHLPQGSVRGSPA